MKRYSTLFTFLPVFFLLNGCSGQQPAPNQKNIIGGGCDGCEIMYIGMPAQIDATDTSAGWKEAGRQLFITGIVYQKGGILPAAGVIIYYWQTDSKGYYSPAPGQPEGSKRHGHIRGWVKTDQQGRYSIYTVRPAPYPGRDIPAHIHFSIKEPQLANEYYTDDLEFDDDPLLTTSKRKAHKHRGGSGVLRLFKQGNLQVAEHNIILGLNIPGYPARKAGKFSSGQ